MKTSEKVEALSAALRALASVQPSGQLTRCQQLAAEVHGEVRILEAVAVLSDKALADSQTPAQG